MSTGSNAVSFLKTEVIFSFAGDVGCWGDGLLPCESTWMLLKKERDSTAHCPSLESPGCPKELFAEGLLRFPSHNSGGALRALVS